MNWRIDSIRVPYASARGKFDLFRTVECLRLQRLAVNETPGADGTTCWGVTHTRTGGLIVTGKLFNCIRFAEELEHEAAWDKVDWDNLTTSDLPGVKQLKEIVAQAARRHDCYFGNREPSAAAWKREWGAATTARLAADVAVDAGIEKAKGHAHLDERHFWPGGEEKE